MVIILLFLFSSLIPVFAQKDMQQYNTMLLVDGSSHVNARWGGKPKINVFRQALGDTLAVLNKSPAWGFNTGIRVFGDRSERDVNDCLDARLGNKIDWFEPVVINSVAEGIRPKGRNCLAFAISTVKDDYPKGVKNAQNYLVCVISSRDECSKDEKETLEWISKESQLTATYIIGMNLSQKDSEYLTEIFKSVPGEFINVTDPEKLAPTMITVLNQYCRGIKPSDSIPESAAEGDSKPPESTKPDTAESGSSKTAASGKPDPKPDASGK